MSFGFSVGDFITAIELASKIRKEFVDAPSQFKDISDEVRSLSIVLQDVEIVLSNRELISQQKTELHNIAEGCCNVLEKLENTLDKYGELSSRPKGVGKRVKRVWKRLKWEPEDIHELRSRISSNINLLNAFNGGLTRDSVDKLVRHQDDQEGQAILDWLTPIDYSTQQNDFIGRRQEGTGQWLLNSDEFQTWLNASKRTLFCPGIPGAGKTIITSIVVDDLYTKFQNDASVGIAYFYCNFRRQQEQKSTDLLASLLKQLVQQQPSTPENVKNLYERHKNKRTRPSFDEISKALHSIIADYSRIFIVIDALDECQVSDGGRKRFLAELFDLQVSTEASLFATSRFIPETVKEFEGRSTQLEIRASDDDLQRYLDGHMFNLPSFISYNADLQNEVKAAIINAVDGMFLLAKLHLDSLIDKTKPKEVKFALRKLPKGSDAYDHAYKEAMERIEGQKPGFVNLAKCVLSWITCAKRLLTTLELRHALAVEIGESKIDEENFPEIEIMVSVCAGLVTVDEESDIIRLVHYTAQEYFERTQNYWFSDAQKDIASICMTYLSFDVFETGFCTTNKELEERLRLNPLYDYAARNWGYHAHAASIEVEQLILDFLKSEAKVSGSSQAMMALRSYSRSSQKVPKPMAGAHLAACFGLREAMKALLKNGHNGNVKDGDGRTPLSWAAENGYEAVVELLLATDGVEADSRDIYGRTPLSRAAKWGHETVFKLLIARADVEADSRDIYGRTPLVRAAKRGHEAVVKQLVDRNDVEADSKDIYGRTPLSRAAEWGCEMVVKQLVDRDDVEADLKDKEGRTPLWWAVEWGREAVVKLLVERDDVKADSSDRYGRTPLSRAAKWGRKAMIKLLIERADVEADSRDIYGRTPLARAAKRGHEAVVKLLIDRADVEADSKDIYGRTPLSRAAKNDREAVVKLLIKRADVETNSRDIYGRTPLSRAVNNGREAVIKLLMERADIEADSRDTIGRTPLS